MTPEQKAAYVIAQAACAMAEIAWMQAENQNSVRRGQTIAYREHEFSGITERYLIGHNAVISFFHD